MANKKNTKTQTKKKSTTQNRKAKIEIKEQIKDIKEEISDKIEDFNENIEDAPKWLKIALVAIPAILAIIGLMTLGTYFNSAKEVTITESTLKEIAPSSTLSTVEFIYKATATKYKNNGKTPKYHVAYEGKVRAGFDFDKVKFDINEVKKIITITLPEITLTTSINTDPSTFDFMFLKEKYETDNVFQEALTFCTKDLKNRAKEDKMIKEKAKENAILAMEGFYKSWIESIDKEYTVVIK